MPALSEVQSPKPAPSAKLTIDAQLEASAPPKVDCFFMPRRDWLRLRERLGGIVDPIPFANNFGWVMMSLAGSALLAWIVWVPAYEQIGSDAARIRYAGLAGNLLLIALLMFLAGVLAFIMRNRVRDLEKYSATLIGEDMDHIYKHWGHISAATEQSVPHTGGSPT